jgi:hypothetical protein
MRRSTRLRVEISLIVTSMDRRHAFSEQCMALVISPQGCGFRASQALPLETPVLLSDLPAGASASGRVASCLPLGKDGKSFLIGVALYNHGNVWGIADPPEDWNCPPSPAGATAKAPTGSAPKRKAVWPYNLLAGHDDAHAGRK